MRCTLREKRKVTIFKLLTKNLERRWVNCLVRGEIGAVVRSGWLERAERTGKGQELRLSSCAPDLGRRCTGNLVRSSTRSFIARSASSSSLIYNDFHRKNNSQFFEHMLDMSIAPALLFFSCRTCLWEHRTMPRLHCATRPASFFQPCTCLMKMH